MANLRHFWKRLIHSQAKSIGHNRPQIFSNDENNAESVRMWVQANQDIVFYFQELNTGHVPRSLTGDNMPFVIGIQTKFMFQMMLEDGHNSAVSIDATFGTNKKKVSVTVSHILMVKNHDHFVSIRGCGHLAINDTREADLDICYDILNGVLTIHHDDLRQMAEWMQYSLRGDVL